MTIEKMEIKLDRIDLDNKCNLFLFETAGFSMWPFLKDGEKVIVKRTSIRDLKIGDIILYQADDKTICHRLIRKAVQGEILFYVRADNSTQIEPVTQDMFLGKVTAIIKNNREIINFCTKRQRFINYLIVIIAPWIARTVRIIKPLYSRLQKEYD